jgi:glycosyltransferase involved in cell wall biosynthesis
MGGAPYEIVVVDYDCPDGTADYIERHRAEWLADSPAADLRTVRATNKTRFNLNEARQLGLDAALGTVTLLIDADVTVTLPRLPELAAQAFGRGTLLLGNVPFLPSTYEEASLFFEYQYGAVVDAPLLLPLLADERGLTGTCCVLTARAHRCGGFDPAINEAGYGSDDIEFYLRYVNYEHPALTRLDEAVRNCEALMTRVRLFPDHSLQASDNTEQEKARFYPMDVQESQARNKSFVASTARALSNAARRSLSEPSARRPLLLGQAWPPRLPDGTPEWFPFWFYYWYSVALSDRGTLKEHRHLFPSELWNESGTDDSNHRRYRMGTLAYRLERDADAARFFERVLYDPGERSPLLRAGASYYMGELRLRADDVTGARRHFEGCLLENPDHRAARRRLGSMGEG